MTFSQNRVRLTQAIVEAAAPGIIWDADLKGYGLRVSPKGMRTYFVHGRTPNGVQIKVSLGRHGRPWTAEQARGRAIQLLHEIRSGSDPGEQKQQETQHATGSHAIGADSGRRLGEYLREAVRAFMRFGPDPPGEATGGEVRLDFDKANQGGKAPAQQLKER